MPGADRWAHCLTVIAWAAILCGFQVVHEFEVVMSEGCVVFRSDAIQKGLDAGNRYRLLDLAVLKKECSSECTKWYIVAKERGEDSLIGGDIRYGRVLRGMDERVAAARLTPGKYSVSATVEALDGNDQPLSSMLLYGEFVVMENGLCNQADLFTS